MLGTSRDGRAWLKSHAIFYWRPQSNLSYIMAAAVASQSTAECVPTSEGGTLASHRAHNTIHSLHCTSQAGGICKCYGAADQTRKFPENFLRETRLHIYAGEIAVSLQATKGARATKTSGSAHWSEEAMKIGQRAASRGLVRLDSHPLYFLYTLMYFLQCGHASLLQLGKYHFSIVRHLEGTGGTHRTHDLPKQARFEASMRAHSRTHNKV